MKNMKEQMKEMERNMNQQQATQGAFQKGQPQPRPKEGDYIDYEEVK